MSLLTLFLAVVLAGLGQGALLRRAARRMTYRRSFSRAAAFCGEQAEMVEVLANPSRLPLPWVRVQSRMPAGLGFSPMSMREINGGLYHRSFFFLAPAHPAHPPPSGALPAPGGLPADHRGPHRRGVAGALRPG